jgi:FK506-binding nuclear protein
VLRSVTVAPGEKVKVVPQADLKIVNVALGHELSDASGRTTLTITYRPPTPISEDEDEEDEDEADIPESTDSETAVLCSLTPGKVRLLMHLFESLNIVS